VTAEEWEACRTPERMLEAVREHASARKVRLFAAACCRAVLDLLADDRGRLMVEAAERLADGPRGRREVRRFDTRSPAAYGDDHDPSAEWAAWLLTRPDPVAGAQGCLNNLRNARAGDRAGRAAIARCIFANPFRPPFTVSPATLAHNDGTAVKLATVIYNDRDPATGLLDPARLAILADALEEAGVEDAAALAHLRGPGAHCRGCHVVDAVLGRT
jgi:hypothetical protein